MVRACVRGIVCTKKRWRPFMVVRCGARVELGVCVRMFLSPLHSYWWASIKEIKRISSLNFTRKKTIVCQFLFFVHPLRREDVVYTYDFVTVILVFSFVSIFFCCHLLCLFFVPFICSFRYLPFPARSRSALPAFVLLTIFNSLYRLLFSQGFLPVFVLLLVCDYFFLLCSSFLPRWLCPWIWI